MTKTKQQESRGERAKRLYLDTPIWKTLLIMAIPAAILMFVSGSYLFFDSVLSINFAADEYVSDVLSATDKVRLYMSGYAPINALMLAFNLLFALGVATRVSINLGAGRRERAMNTIKTGTMISMIMSILMVPILIGVAKPWIASQYDASIADMVADNAFVYAWPVIISYPFMMFNQLVSSLLRVEARNKQMMIALLAPIGINLLLDWVFMGPVGMGVEGGAWATFTSNVVTSLLLIFFILRTPNSMITFKNMFGLKFGVLSVVGIILVGISPFARNVAQSITSTVQMNVVKDVSAHAYANASFTPDQIQATQVYVAFNMVQSGDLLITGVSKGMEFKDAAPTILAYINDPANAVQVAGITKVAQGALAANFMTVMVTGVMPLFMLFFPIMFGFAQAGRPVASFNYGAKQYDRVKQVYWYTILYAAIAGVMIYFLAAWALGSPLMDLLKVKGQYKEEAEIAVKIMMLAVPLFAFAIGSMVFYGSTDRLIMSIVSSAMQGIILFFPVIFTFKELAINSDYRFMFWWMWPTINGLASVLLTSFTLYSFRGLGKKDSITLDMKIDNFNNKLRARFSRNKIQRDVE